MLAHLNEHIRNWIKKKPQLKKRVHNFISCSIRPRPRFYIRWFINPLVHTRLRKSFISKRSRQDVFPFNRFCLGDRSVIEDFATINNGVGDVIIGSDSLIGLGCTIIGPVSIGNFVILAQNVVVSGLNHNYQDIALPISKQGVFTDLVSIDHEAWIGANSSIIPGVKIGRHAVVAAGSIVTHDVPDFCIVAGNPARIIKQYNPSTKEWEKVSPKT